MAVETSRNRGDDSHLEAKCDDCHWVLSTTVAEDFVQTMDEPMDVVVADLREGHESKTGHTTTRIQR